MSLVRFSAIVLAPMVSCSGCKPPDAQEPSPLADPVSLKDEVTAEKVIEEFEGYQMMTVEPVNLSPSFYADCAVTPEMTRHEEKHGPHANYYLLIYMNDIASRAYRDSATPYPIGSVVVKKKTSDRYAVADNPKENRRWYGLGGMIKRPAGYDPEHGDWEYFYFEKPSPVETGKIVSCVECHAKAKDRDYVYGNWRTHVVTKSNMSLP